MSSRLAGLAPRIQRWVEYEQTLNERLIDPARYASIEHRGSTVRPELRPERRPVWDQPVVWLPRSRVRAYGPVAAHVHEAFGVAPGTGLTPMFLHPQAPAAQRRLAGAFGLGVLPGVCATPTASYRSVVTWRRPARGAAVVLKLSLGAVIGRRRRRLTERSIAQAVVMSAVFDTIPVADRRRLQLDWFSEPCGVVEGESGQGWLLRRLPAWLAARGATTLMPLFSLISRPGDNEVPLLVRWIRQSRRAPEEFVIDSLIRPFVHAEAYLLFEQGVQHEGHAQNVLVEVDAREQFTGRLVLRDFSDTSVNIAFRLAKRKPLPTFGRGLLPRGTPFRVAGNVGDHHTNFRRPFILRGFDTVEQYGLGGFVWPINASLARHFGRYDAASVAQQYLELWQQEAVRYLKLRPLLRETPRGLATDETIARFLRTTDWRALGARPARLPAAAEPLLGEGRQRRRAGRVYERLESPWGDMFLSEGCPAFFRPAF
jgi:hypothetical protein